MVLWLAGWGKSRQNRIPTLETGSNLIWITINNEKNSMKRLSNFPYQKLQNSCEYLVV